ncbi:hypothetical protein [Bifidobacterium boum]|uniref:hypothetical protein n=1 Tax=Bifidobacterium boum TaxID=78343 RepID=UPI003F90BE4B
MNTGPWEWTLSATLTVVSLAVSLFITIVGWVATAVKDSRNAKAAREKYEADVRRADEMNATFKSQLEAARESAEALHAQVEQLEEANRIADDANPFTSVPWSDAEWTKHGSQFTIRNKSSRNVVVVKLSASDEKLDRQMRFDQQPPFICEPNSRISYLALGTMQTGTPDTAIEWHWDGSDEIRTTVRQNIK